MIPFLAALLGGAAEGIYKTGKDAQDEERTMRLRQMESDLEMKRQEAVQAMRERADQAKEERISARNKSDAGLINSTAADTRVERAKSMIEADTGIKHTNEEVKNIIADPSWTQNYGAVHQTQTGADTEWQGGGLINQRTNLVPSKERTAYQEQMDLSNAAGGIGRTDLQDRYTRAAQAERQLTSDENRYASSERRADQQDKKQEQMFEWQKTQAGLANRRADLSEQRASRAADMMELRDSRADDESKRRAAATALKDLEEKSKEIKRGIDTGMLNPEALKIDQAELKSLDAERARYRNLLGGMSGLPAAPESVGGSKIDSLFPAKNTDKPGPKPAKAEAKSAEPAKPARDFYSDPARKNKGAAASQSDISSAQQEVNALQIKYNAAPTGDGKNISGPANAARIQIANALAEAKDRLQKLLDQGK